MDFLDWITDLVDGTEWGTDEGASPRPMPALLDEGADAYYVGQDVGAGAEDSLPAVGDLFGGSTGRDPVRGI